MKKHFFPVLLLSVSLGFGVALSSNDAHAADLATDIAQSKVQSPHLYRAVSDMIANAESLDAHARKRGMPFTARFKALGPNALLPMLDALASDAQPPAGTSESAKLALRIGLLEAVGSIRDERALPIVERILDRSTDARIVHAASTALSRVGTDRAVATLVRVQASAQKSEPNGPRERAILEGMHDARRATIAKLLASRIATADDATAKIIAHSLGGVANAWAWRASADQSELAETRTTAARALVDLYVARGGDARDAAAKAILVVDDPSTPATIASARKGANADVAKALDELDRRFASNPTR